MGIEACGIDVFKTARDNGFHINTKKETYGKWNYFALCIARIELTGQFFYAFNSNMQGEIYPSS